MDKVYHLRNLTTFLKTPGFGRNIIVSNECYDHCYGGPNMRYKTWKEERAILNCTTGDIIIDTFQNFVNCFGCKELLQRRLVEFETIEWMDRMDLAISMNKALILDTIVTDFTITANKNCEVGDYIRIKMQSILVQRDME